MQGPLYRKFYARCRLNCGIAFHTTGFCSAAFHSTGFCSAAFHSTYYLLAFAVLPCTVLVCHSCLGGVCFPLYARDSIDWFAGAKMDQ